MTKIEDMALGWSSVKESYQHWVGGRSTLGLLWTWLGRLMPVCGDCFVVGARPPNTPIPEG